MTHPATLGLRSTVVGILANALLAAIKAIAGVLGNSYALIADAIESTLDVAGSIIVWSGLKVSTLPPDHDHPYGHGKAEPLAAAVVAFMLITAAAGIAVQSIREIATPHHAPEPFTLAVLVLVIIAKELLSRFTFQVGVGIRSTAVKVDAMHHRSDAITSAAAFIGIAIALIGGEGYESADDWAALFASGIIAYNGTRLLRPAINEVMDAAPSDDMELLVRQATKTVPGVVDVEKCYVRKMGFSYYVDIHVTVDGNMTVYNGHEIASNVKTVLRSKDGRIEGVLVHVEPQQMSGVHSPVPRPAPKKARSLTSRRPTRRH